MLLKFGRSPLSFLDQSEGQPSAFPLILVRPSGLPAPFLVAAPLSYVCPCPLPAGLPSRHSRRGVADRRVAPSNTDRAADSFPNGPHRHSLQPCRLCVHGRHSATLPTLFFPSRPRLLVRAWHSVNECARSIGPARRPVLWSLLALLAVASSFLTLVIALAHTAASAPRASNSNGDNTPSNHTRSLIDMSAPSASVPNLGAGVAAIRLDVTKISAPAQHAQAADNSIALLLELPDGKTELLKFRPDLTVGYVKVEVAKKHGIPFDCQELELAGKPMADPFSLSDYPALKASRANDPVRVVLRRVVPSDGEGDDADLPDDAPAAKGGDSDYDDESFDE